MVERRIYEARGETADRDERTARFTPGEQGLAQHRRREQRGAFRRVGVQSRQQNRTPKALIERPRAFHHVAERRRPRRPQSPQRREILVKRGAWNAAAWVEKPPWRPAVVRTQAPAFVALQIGEIERRRRRSLQPCARSDAVKIV